MLSKYKMFEKNMDLKNNVWLLHFWQYLISMFLIINSYFNDTEKRTFEQSFLSKI